MKDHVSGNFISTHRVSLVTTLKAKGLRANKGSIIFCSLFAFASSNNLMFNYTFHSLNVVGLITALENDKQMHIVHLILMMIFGCMSVI